MSRPSTSKKKSATLPSLLFAFAFLVCFQSKAQTTSTYSNGTIWHPPFYNIITEDDPSCFQSVTYEGEKNATMWDREANNNQGAWVKPMSWIYRLRYDDGLSAEIRIRQEGFSSNQAAIFAKTYGRIMGQLPACLRAGVKDINIMKGDALFGGNNSMRSIDITIGKTSELYFRTGNMEETIAHEATHAALDYLYKTSNYLTNRNMDPMYISKYAYDNPDREDISETFLLFMALTRTSNRITSEAGKIKRDIGNRLRFFESLNLVMYPFSKSGNLVTEEQGRFDPNAWYRLTTQWQGDGKALDILNSGRQNQPVLAQTTNASGQFWKITWIRDDLYTLHTMWQGDEKLLTCPANYSYGRPLLNYSSASSKTSLWKITLLDNGYYRIENSSARMSLDIINDGTNNQIKVARKGDFSGQYWKLTKVN